MLTVTVDLIPMGDKDYARELEHLTIINDGTGTKELGNYTIMAYSAKALRRGVVKNYDRSLGPLALVKAAIESLGEPE